MIRTYIGEKPIHTHENTGLEDFLARLEPQWGGSAELITVIAHAMWNGAEIDAVCILPRAIAVIDFKSHGGRVQISENGPWQRDSGLIKGGSKLNPFVQVRDNKHAVMSWLNDKHILSSCNLGHISGVVLFTHPVQIEGDLGPRINSWFHVTDFDHCAEKLAALASPSIRADEASCQQIVRGLGVREYRSLRSRIVPVGGGTDSVRADPPLTEKQRETIETIVRFIRDPDCTSLSVLGMTHSGKTRLLRETVKEVEKTGRQSVVLVPNARVSTHLYKRHGLSANSIYSHVYDRSGARQEKVLEEPDKRAREITVFPPRDCTDPKDCVYLIDEAHLIGNDYFEMEDGKRYGSGRLVEDFIDFATLGESKRKVILYGDPYQLPRGRREAMPLFGDPQRARGLTTTEIRVSEMHEAPEHSVLLGNARRIVESIDSSTYSTLRLEEGEGVSILPKEKSADRVTTSYQARLDDSWFITETHSKVNQFNKWIRPRLFKGASAQSIVSGDLLEFHFGADEDEPDPFGSSASPLVAGDRVTVQGPPDPLELHTQSLKGREAPIEFATRRLKATFGAGQKSLVVLENFLLAEKPELPQDVTVAIDVWKKSNPKYALSGVRYGYATTCHHAQGMTRPICIVDANCTTGHHTEAYFRWMYTAITRATQQCFIVNYKSVDSFDEARWNDKGAVEDKTIPLGGRWAIGSSSTAGDPASHRSECLGKTIQKLLEPHGWQVTETKSVPYQEQYTIKHRDTTENRLIVSYNKNDEVTGMRLADARIAPDLILSLAEAVTVGHLTDANAHLILQGFKDRIASKGLRIVGTWRDGDYRLTVILISGTDERAQIELNHGKEGIVSTIRLVKYGGSEIASIIKKIYSPSDGDA